MSNSDIKIWLPHVVVASVVCQKQNGIDKFLLVREHTVSGVRVNQPAGHWDEGETLIEAVIRETREETGYELIPKGLLGIYSIKSTNENISYLRFAFVGDVAPAPPAKNLDHGIIEAIWWEYSEIIANKNLHRSALVLQVIEDYYKKTLIPLSVINHVSI